jgi:hypothetical protein
MRWQGCQPVQSFGSFNCQVCGIEVFSWYGDYDYVGWSAIDTTPARR